MTNDQSDELEQLINKATEELLVTAKNAKEIKMANPQTQDYSNLIGGGVGTQSISFPSSPEKDPGELEIVYGRFKIILADSENVLKRLTVIADEIFGQQPQAQLKTSEDAPSPLSTKPPKIYALGKVTSDLEKLVHSIHVEINRFERL